MDNKRVYKRISTCFWFLLATFPLWFSILGSLFIYFIHFDNNTAFNALDFTQGTDSIFKLGSTSFTYLLRQLCGSNVGLANFTPIVLKTLFVNLFYNAFNINFGDSLVVALSNSIAWFCWVYFIELMVDFVVWLPKMCHSWIERWCKD